jgi:hypothetical protein
MQPLETNPNALAFVQSPCWSWSQVKVALGKQAWFAVVVVVSWLFETPQ